MGKELAISKSQLDRLMSVGFTGHDIGAGNIYPSSVNILQSDKQYEAFSDGDNITKKMYGQLFVRTDSNTTADLSDKIEGTIIKIERGYEIRNSENKIEQSGYGFLNALEKSEWEEKGLNPVNMVKILLALGDYKTVDSKMVALKKKLDNGELPKKSDYPFCIVAVKGASFGNWFSVEKGMQDIANEYFKKPVSQIPVVGFKLVVKSSKESGSDFTYYCFDFEVKPNDPEEAINFTKYMLEAKDQNLFYKVKERVEDDEYNAMKETKEAVEVIDIEEGVDDEDEDPLAADLPF